MNSYKANKVNNKYISNLVILIKPNKRKIVIFVFATILYLIFELYITFFCSPIWVDCFDGCGTSGYDQPLTGCATLNYLDKKTSSYIVIPGIYLLSIALDSVLKKKKHVK